MDLIGELNKNIQEVSGVLGKPLEKEKYEVIDRRLPHKPETLPRGMIAV